MKPIVGEYPKDNMIASVTPPPVEWKVVYSTPTRYLLNKSLAIDLLPPDDQTPEKMNIWCRNQAEQIVAFSTTAAGGSLVLCTSYDQMNSLKTHLETLGIETDRIIKNSGNLVEDKKKFVEAHASGKRPLWLVLGPGWTGVDLVEQMAGAKGELVNVPAAADTLLTDLIITRIPFGLNRSATQMARMDRNFKTTTYEAMLLLKQGLGRLIRRDGLKNRRILVLDGRLQQSNLHPFMAAAVKDVFLLLGKYTKKQIFPA